jgi:hypothetical protein
MSSLVIPLAFVGQGFLVHQKVLPIERIPTGDESPLIQKMLDFHHRCHIMKCSALEKSIPVFYYVELFMIVI